MERCAGTFSTFKVCINQPHHKRFYGASLDSRLIWSSLSPVVLFFARQILTKEPNIIRNGYVQQAAIMYEKPMEKLNEKRRTDIRNTAIKFPNTQMFPLHTLYHLLTYQMDHSWFDRAMHLHANLWKISCRFRLDMFDVDSIQVLDCGASDVTVKALNIPHNIVGFGFFSMRPFDAGEIVGYYDEILNDSDRMTQNQIQTTFGNGLISFSIENVITLALKFPETFLNARGKNVRGYYRPNFVVCGL